MRTFSLSRWPLAAALLGAALATFTATGVQAQTGALPGVDARQARQEARIAHGAAQGRLTPAEARHLQHQQARIRHAERRALHDGVVTRHERRHLAQLQQQAHRQIHRATHNGRHLHHQGWHRHPNQGLHAPLSR